MDEKKSVKRTTSTKRKQLFPELLYTILELAAIPQGLGNYNNAITWLSHGRAFKILDRNEFEQVIPMFFKATKIRSFHRQLNLWGECLVYFSFFSLVYRIYRFIEVLAHMMCTHL